MKMLRGLLGLFLFTLTLGIGLLAWDLHQGLHAADLTTRHFDDLVSDISVDYAFKSEAANHILYASRVAADQGALLMIEQRRQLAKTSLDSDRSVKALRLTIDRAGILLRHTDEELNRRTLPQITAAVESSVLKIGQSADALTGAGNTLNLRLRDPEIDSMLVSYNDAAKNLAAMSAGGNSSMGHVDHILAYADKQLTTPIGFWKNLLLHEALPAAGSAGSFLAGFVKR